MYKFIKPKSIKIYMQASIYLMFIFDVYCQNMHCVINCSVPKNNCFLDVEIYDTKYFHFRKMHLKLNISYTIQSISINYNITTDIFEHLF
jgi:hypothetical protein